MRRAIKVHRRGKAHRTGATPTTTLLHCACTCGPRHARPCRTATTHAAASTQSTRRRSTTCCCLVPSEHCTKPGSLLSAGPPPGKPTCPRQKRCTASQNQGGRGRGMDVLQPRVDPFKHHQQEAARRGAWGPAQAPSSTCEKRHALECSRLRARPCPRCRPCAPSGPAAAFRHATRPPTNCLLGTPLGKSPTGKACRSVPCKEEDQNCVRAMPCRAAHPSAKEPQRGGVIALQCCSRRRHHAPKK